MSKSVILHCGKINSHLKFEKDIIDKELLKTLKKSFEFQLNSKYLQNRFNLIRRYKNTGKWFDGKACFFNVTKKGGSFPTGIFSDITFKLKEMGVDYKIVDESAKIPIDEILDSKLNLSPTILHTNPDSQSGDNITLFNFQYQILSTIINENHPIGGIRGVVKCATGGGKTIIFSALIKALMEKEYQTVILFRSKTLVNQTYKVLEKVGIKSIGRLNSEYLEIGNNVICSTVQSIHKLPPSLIQNTSILLIDECHQFSSKTSIDTLKMFENAWMRLGFSATPWKETNPIHNWKIKSWIGHQICDISTDYLQSTQILSKSIALFHQIPLPKRIKSLQYEEALLKGIVENDHLNQKIKDIVDSIEEGRILILVQRLSHGDTLSNLIPGAYWVKGEDSSSTREFVLEKLRNSTDKKVVAIFSSIGFIGVNVYVHHLINAFGGKDSSVTIQIMGRGLRKAKDKDVIFYHDFYNTTNHYLEEHSKQRISTLSKEGHKILKVDGIPNMISLIQQEKLSSLKNTGDNVVVSDEKDEDSLKLLTKIKKAKTKSNKKNKENLIQEDIDPLLSNTEANNKRENLENGDPENPIKSSKTKSKTIVKKSKKHDGKKDDSGLENIEKTITKTKRKSTKK